MAYTKVSDLTALTSPDGAEELLVNDGGTSKKITITNATASKLPLAGGTMTGALDFGDNVKANFGASDDLQIFHNASDSILYNATGALILRGADVRIQASDGGETSAKFVDNGTVELYYDNSKKFETTNTGIDVTGTVTADGLSINSGTTNTIGTFTSTDSGAAIRLIDNTGNSTIETNGATLRISADDDDTLDDSIIKFRIDGATKVEIDDDGKVYINETAITSPSNAGLLQVASSDASLWSSIGTGGNAYNSMISEISVMNTQDDATNSYAGIFFQAGETTAGSAINAARIGAIRESAFNTSLVFATRSSVDGMAERMRINSSGNVGIGDTSPSEAKLSIDNVAAGDIGLQIVNAQATSGIFIDQNGDGRGIDIDSEANSRWSIETKAKYGINATQDISGGRAAYFSRNLAEAGSNSLVQIVDDHTSNTQPALGIQQDGAGYGLHIDQNGDGNALRIDSASSTTHAIQVQSKWGINCQQDTTGGLAGWFERNVDEAGAYPLVSIIDNHTANTQPALKVKQDGAGKGIEIDQNGNGNGLYVDSAATSSTVIKSRGKLALGCTQTISGGYAAHFDRNIAESGTYPLVNIKEDNANNTQPALFVVQAGSGNGIKIDQNGDSNALYIDSESTNENALAIYGKYGIYVDQDISGGRAAYFIRNLAEAGSSPLVTINDTHTSNTAQALKITQDGAGKGLHIEQNGNGNAIKIESGATTGTALYVTANSMTGASGLKVITSSANLESTATGGFAKIAHTGNSGANVNNLLYIHNDHASSTGTTALYVQQDSTGAAAVFKDGNVGLGINSPSEILHLHERDAAAKIRIQKFEVDGHQVSDQVIGAVEFWSNDDHFTPSGGSAGDGGLRASVQAIIEGTSADTGLQFFTGASNADAVEAMRIDYSGNLLKGHSSSITQEVCQSGTVVSSWTPDVQINRSNNGGLAISQWNTGNTASANIWLTKSSSNTIGTHAGLAENEVIGRIIFSASDGSDFSNGASIEAFADTGQGSNDTPARLEFKTTADGATTPTTRMTIDSSGDVTVDTGNLVIGTAGKGIDFSAQTASTSGTTTSEVLDHYEEGTWTATTTTTGTPFTTTDNTTTSKYTKIGNQVTVFFNPVIDTPTLGTGDVRITGLPFASNVTTITSAMRWGRYDLHSSASFSPAMEGEPFGAVLATGNEIYIYYNSHYANPTAYPASGLNGNATPYCAGSLTYTTD